MPETSASSATPRALPGAEEAQGEFETPGGEKCKE